MTDHDAEEPILSPRERLIVRLAPFVAFAVIMALGLAVP
jgi:hypothetical protein